MMSIYEFSDPIEYVNRQFSLKKEVNPRFSLRSYAKILGYQNPSLLSSVLKGERKLNTELAEKIAKQLHLKNDEVKYFQILILIKYAKNESERLMYTELLESARPGRLGTEFSVSIDSFRFIDDWYHAAILEMIELKNFKFNYEWMAKKLGRGLNAELVEAAVSRLVRLGLITNEKKKLLRKQGSFIVDKNIPSDAIKKHHDQFIQFARAAIFDQPIHTRDIRSATISMKRKDYKKIQDIIKKAHAEILEFSCQGDGEDVFQLCTQFFQLTQNQEELDSQNTVH